MNEYVHQKTLEDTKGLVLWKTRKDQCCSLYSSHQQVFVFLDFLPDGKFLDFLKMKETEKPDFKIID